MSNEQLGFMFCLAAKRIIFDNATILPFRQPEIKPSVIARFERSSNRGNLIKTAGFNKRRRRFGCLNCIKISALQRLWRCVLPCQAKLDCHDFA